MSVIAIMTPALPPRVAHSLTAVDDQSKMVVTAVHTASLTRLASRSHPELVVKVERRVTGIPRFLFESQ
jgi:hypothetical protein